jgi:pyruvate/2-oxoglutarate dehydrogenase complex dihydrolipoamide dehydrogenase (E3) component
MRPIGSRPPRTWKHARRSLTTVDEEGIEIAFSVFVTSARRESDEIVATIAPRDGSEPNEVRVAQVMLASGRVPNIEGLDLEAAGVETSKVGIVVDEYLRTTVPGLWAAGDVNAVAQLTPIAQYQARVAVADMFGDDVPPADYSVLPTSIFTDPELGGVGLTEEQAKDEGYDVEVVKNEFVRRFSYIDAKHGLQDRLRRLEPPGPWAPSFPGARATSSWASRSAYDSARRSASSRRCITSSPRSLRG